MWMLFAYEQLIEAHSIAVGGVVGQDIGPVSRRHNQVLS